MKILPPGGKDGSHGTRLACSASTCLDDRYSTFRVCSPSIDAEHGTPRSRSPREWFSNAVRRGWGGTNCTPLAVLSLAPSDDKSRREAKPLVHPQDAYDSPHSRLTNPGRASGTDCRRAARAFPSMAMGV